MEYYSSMEKKKKESFTFCDGMDGPGEHYATWHKAVRERLTPCDFTHMWNLWTNGTNKQNRDRLTDREQDGS